MRRLVDWLILVAVLFGLLAGQISPAAAARGFVLAPGSPFAPGVERPAFVDLGDLNGDGNLDAVVPHLFAPQQAVLLGDGSGRLSPAPGSPFITTGRGGEIGDFNGDGKLDLAVAEGNIFGNSVSVMLGDGEGGLHRSSAGVFPIDRPARDLAAADFNRDGRLDLAVPSGPGTLVLLGDGQGGFSPAPGSPFSTQGTPRLVAVADFNGDGSADLTVANGNPALGVWILLGDGNGAFSPAAGSPYLPGSGVAGLAAGDFNRDRIPDLAATVGGSPPDSPFAGVAVLLGDGDGGFRAPRGSPFLTHEDAINSLALGDFNGDRKLDAAVAGEGANDVPVFLGDGRGALRPMRGGPFRSGGDEPGHVIAGDINGDRRSDLVVTNFVSNDVSVLLSRRAR